MFRPELSSQNHKLFQGGRGRERFESTRLEHAASGQKLALDQLRRAATNSPVHVRALAMLHNMYVYKYTWSPHNHNDQGSCVNTVLLYI